MPPCIPSRSSVLVRSSSSAVGDLATGDDDPEVECSVVVVIVVVAVVIVILSVLLPVVELEQEIVGAETFIMVVIESSKLVAVAVRLSLRDFVRVDGTLGWLLMRGT